MDQQLEASILGMWVFLVTEVMFFGGLFLAYIVYRTMYPEAWVAGSNHLNVYMGGLNTAVLICSSLTMVLAVAAAQKRDDRGTTLWLTVTGLLGATFVGGQVYEFTAFVKEGLGYTTNIFSSAFYTLTGFHGVHVSVGVILLLSTMGIIRKNRITGNKAEVVEMVGLYWHFVDIVWIVIFTLVYLIPA